MLNRKAAYHKTFSLQGLTHLLKSRRMYLVFNSMSKCWAAAAHSVHNICIQISFFIYVLGILKPLGLITSCDDLKIQNSEKT